MIFSQNRRIPKGNLWGFLWGPLGIPKGPLGGHKEISLEKSIWVGKCWMARFVSEQQTLRAKKLAKVTMHERTRVSTLKSGPVPQKEVHGGCSFSPTGNKVEPRIFMFVAKMLQKKPIASLFVTVLVSKGSKSKNVVFPLKTRIPRRYTFYVSFEI